jgi:hypothetical protein
VVEKAKVLLNVAPDGKFTASECYSDPCEHTPDWTGEIRQGVRLSGLRTSEAECRGIFLKNTTELTGIVSQKSSTITLEVAGREEMCLSLGCVFQMTYRLERQP